MSVAIVIMAKHPYETPVKTRLATRLDTSQRARLYHAFLSDKLRQVRPVAGARCAIAFAPATARRWFRDFAGAEVMLIAQCEGGLGARVSALFEQLLPQFARGVLLVDSDTPNLPPAYLVDAVRALVSGSELVVGPAEDGGYYLIGLSRAAPTLFDEVEWSCASTREQTLTAARRLGLQTALLDAWYDVDLPADLERLMDELRASPPEVAPSTRDVLAALVE